MSQSRDRTTTMPGLRTRRGLVAATTLVLASTALASCQSGKGTTSSDTPAG